LMYGLALFSAFALAACGAVFAEEQPCGIGHRPENTTCVYDPAAIEDCYGVFCPWIIPINPPEKHPGYAGDCLIATASFGSDLSPRVQMLREVRDGVVLSTRSGTMFMGAFNAVYYSFSPAVAQMEYENPAFRNVVRAFITPMVEVLAIMTLADGGSELQVVVLGMSAISAIAGMYVVGPAVVIRWALRRHISKKRRRPQGSNRCPAGRPARHDAWGAKTPERA